jgi:hypothetical protein
MGIDASNLVDISQAITIVRRLTSAPRGPPPQLSWHLRRSGATRRQNVCRGGESSRHRAGRHLLLLGSDVEVGRLGVITSHGKKGDGGGVFSLSDFALISCSKGSVLSLPERLFGHG